GMLAVGASGTPTCPRPGGAWAESNLFDNPVLPPELLAYCLYQWTDPNNAPAFGLLPNAPDGRSPDVWLEPDCNVVAPFAHPFEQKNARTLEDAWIAQIEATSTLPRLGIPLATKVMVVDASIDSAFPVAGPGTLEHGELVGTIIRRLSCPL